VAALVAAVLAGSGCDLPTPAAHPRLWTLTELRALAANPASADRALAPAAGIPGGIRVSHFLTADDSGAVSLTLGEAWTEGQRSAYVTTELWTGFASVWVQPLYQPVVAWRDDGFPEVALGDDGLQHPIFSVAPGSLFYGPYWQVIYFELPPGKTASDFRSSRQVIESGAALHPAGAALCVLAPPGPIAQPTDTTAAAGSRGIGKITTLTGWVDERPVNVFSFPNGSFRWDAGRVVEELPLFTFTARDDQGDLETIDGVPTVGGSGPIGSGRPPDLATPSGQPHYGALWRAYTVTIPATARVFAPPQAPALVGALTNQRLPFAPLGPEIMNAAAADVQLWAGRIAMNPACFDTLAHLDPASGAGSCVWLDSQAAIEREIDGFWIRKTDALLTCPFVSYADRAVPGP
jgi:hypothetical protein